MKHSYLTMWFPRPDTPDYALSEQERLTFPSKSEPFEERYPNVSGTIIHDKDTGSVREIKKYECFYETDEACTRS